MPKITVHGGPSIEGVEEPSVGTSSSTSSTKSATSSEPSKPESPKPVRATGSRSKKPRTGASTARSTGGGPESAE